MAHFGGPPWAPRIDRSAKVLSQQQIRGMTTTVSVRYRTELSAIASGYVGWCTDLVEPLSLAFEVRPAGYPWGRLDISGQGASQDTCRLG